METENDMATTSSSPISQPRNQRPSLKTAIPGPRSQEIRQREDELVAPGVQNFALLAGIVVDQAYGNLVRDVDGNELLDIIGGIGVNGLGHSHPKWVQAIQEQVEKSSVGSFTSQARVQLLEKINQHQLHKSLDRLQLYSSGAEAVESALRLAKSYTKKYEFVSFWGGFHGKTLGVLSLMGSNFKDRLGPYAPGSQIVPYANCYRCPLNLKHPSCGLACADLARKQIKMNSSGEIAAFIIEPMQGTAGNIIPPKEFLVAVQEMARENDALFIADEMITGFGRTGRFWGSEHSGVLPDIVTIGKQFGGGYPLSGVITRKEIAEAQPWSNPSGSSSSYGGNPLGATAARAAIEIIEQEKLVENSSRVGEYFLSRLKPFEEKYSFVGDVRGLGLLIGMELVKDKDSKEPLSKEVCKTIFLECLKRGLLTMAYSPHFRIQPAMTIDEQTVDHVVEILKEVFDEIEEKKVWKN